MKHKWRKLRNSKQHCTAQLNSKWSQRRSEDSGWLYCCPIRACLLSGLAHIVGSSCLSYHCRGAACVSLIRCRWNSDDCAV